VRLGVRLRLVEHEVLADRAGLVPQLGGEGAAGRERVLDRLLALVDCALGRLVALLEEVFSTFAGLTAELGLVGRQEWMRAWRRGTAASEAASGRQRG
jgi:hypothetical protein